MAFTAASKIKNVETVVKGTDVQVLPWHFHRDSTDYYFVLEGFLSISTREPALTKMLQSVSAIRLRPEQHT